MRVLLTLLVTTLVAGGLAAAASPREALDGFERFVRKDGSLHFSRASTRDFVHLGSWFVPAGDASGFHHVYAQAGAVEAYRETGAFPDGTALVKEIVSHERGAYTTGADVARATVTRSWFLMVKDSAGRFDGNPLWGNGWGWALFEAADPTQNVATDFRRDCLGCHAPAQQSDWVYVENYPSLQARGNSAPAMP